MLRGATASVLQAVLVFLPPCLRQVYRAYISQSIIVSLLYHNQAIAANRLVGAIAYLKLWNEV